MVRLAGSQRNGPKYGPCCPMVADQDCWSALVGRPRSYRAAFCSSTAARNRLSPARRSVAPATPGTSGPNRRCRPVRRLIDRSNVLPPRPAMIFQRLLVGLADLCRRNALLVVVAGVLVAVFAGCYAGRSLGIDPVT